MAMGIPVCNPNVSAHSRASAPAARSAEYALAYNRSRRRPSPGSSRHRNSRDGRPPHPSEYSALWPAAHTPRTMSPGAVTPAKTDGTKSASSTQLAAASNTSGATLRQCQILDQNHSDEYVPPIGDRYSGAQRRAVSVMAAASSAAVWSFHSHACAASESRQRGSRASGRLPASTGSGVEPVVSTPIPMTRWRAKPACVSACANAPRTDAVRPTR